MIEEQIEQFYAFYNTNKKAYVIVTIIIWKSWKNRTLVENENVYVASNETKGHFFYKTQKIYIFLF